MSRMYVGRRENGEKWVEVVAAGLAKPLEHCGGQPGDTFGWGGQAAGSVTLARAILLDLLGTESSHGMAIIFAGDVLSRLPDEAFALGEAQVHRWLDAQDQDERQAMEPDELVEHLGAIALAGPEEELETLRDLVDRCWSARSLVN